MTLRETVERLLADFHDDHNWALWAEQELRAALAEEDRPIPFNPDWICVCGCRKAMHFGGACMYRNDRPGDAGCGCVGFVSRAEEAARVKELEANQRTGRIVHGDAE